MQLSHDAAVVDVVFDEGNLVSCTGLVPVMALAEQAGSSELLAGQLTVRSANAPVKVTAVVACVDIDDTVRETHGYGEQGGGSAIRA